MKLMQPLFKQGYCVFFDNFYTSVTLLVDLYAQNNPACGTVTEDRKGFPVSTKNGKQWTKGKPRGEMRGKREGSCLSVQWINNKVVTMLYTIDNANEYVADDRKVKVNCKWEKAEVKKPYVVERYNTYMNGVDKSDQILSKHNLSLKCVRWRKTLFYITIDIIVVYGFILFQQHRKNKPDLVTLKRHSRYSLLDFREEIIRNIMSFEEYAEPSTFTVHKPVGSFTSEHIP